MVNSESAPFFHIRRSGLNYNFKGPTESVHVFREAGFILVFDFRFMSVHAFVSIEKVSGFQGSAYRLTSFPLQTHILASSLSPTSMLIL